MSWLLNGTTWLYGLRDAADRWFSEDKYTHYGFAGWYWQVLQTWGDVLPPSWRVALFLAGALGIELLELWRYRRWDARGRPGSWPLLADKISPKDLVWNLAGAITAQLLIFIRAAAWVLGL